MLAALGTQAQQPARDQARKAPPAPQTYTISLAQAIDYSTKNSIAVKNALLDYQMQEQVNRATTSSGFWSVWSARGNFFL